jgi:ATP phosphoribosyltransferase
VLLGVADAVATLVDTVHGSASIPPSVRRIGVIESCRMVVLDGRASDDGIRPAKRAFLARMHALRHGADVLLLQYDCPTAWLPRVTTTFDSASTSEIATLDQPGWSRVRLLLGADLVLDHTERLLAFGCRDIVTFDPLSHVPGPPISESSGTDDGRVVLREELVPDGLPEPRDAAEPSRAGSGVENGASES